MTYGQIEYNLAGLPKCEICNQYYHRVLCHVRQKHHMTEREYKKMFGFDLIRGITSLVSKEKSRAAVLNNFETVVTKNLLCKGKDSRFKNGHTGRTKELVSKQTQIRLKNRLYTEDMQNAMKKSGRALGLSGSGNKARWGLKND
jgi:hypothetical protein